ncbi:MAG: hypothetical protein ACKVOJ_00180 [Sphingomonadaceae bacterium]
MLIRNRIKAFNRSPLGRLTMFVIGILIMIVSPIIGAIPGPGGIFVFAFGLALALRSSLWAKRRYVDLKRWQPRLGSWADWGLRRKSAQRRAAVAKRQAVTE